MTEAPSKRSDPSCQIPNSRVSFVPLYILLPAPVLYAEYLLEQQSY